MCSQLLKNTAKFVKAFENMIVATKEFFENVDYF